MRCSASRYFTLIVIAICLLLATISGCSSPGTSDDHAMSISADEFKVLQNARSELGPFISDASKALNPAYPLATRRQKVNEVIDKYKSKFPEPVNEDFLHAHQQIARKYENEVKGTVTEDLVDLEPNRGGGEASYVAGDYLGVATVIYGLADFEEYIAQHTIDEGSKSNPADPMPVLEGGVSKGFGSREFRGYVAIATSVDPTTGMISYRLSGEEVTDASLSQIENEFINQALGLLKDGDNLLLDDTRL
jgi:hypothetical protein